MGAFALESEKIRRAIVTYVTRNESLLQTKDLRSAYDAPQRQEPLRDRHLYRLDEAASAKTPVTTELNDYRLGFVIKETISFDTRGRDRVYLGAAAARVKK